MNVSEMIAQAIRDMLKEHDGTAYIQRNELAGKLGCVPSQINYVITSRFNADHGYRVESKRGGGGYVKIYRVAAQKETLMRYILQAIGDEIDPHQTSILLQNLCYDKIITEAQGKMIASAVTNQALEKVPGELRNGVRASILKSMLICVCQKG